ncbi:bifunctional DNA-binding transcriptional regulator/O6-methylguanine-DNA methyltransferase Ada [Pigmentiphaga soli]|uniref:Bifunctional DNA-binding transcriptional regulator/O6-methylguanine-DNA methyltransferase Ada n=1 Tax=Pigmentiphaga soli TaxID=1007095 RepID=A0ABP8GKA5_9BURK
MIPEITSPPAAQRYPDDEARWRAVAARDAAAGGHFFYSVRSTGVYCRPGCPARLPRRENVDFHACAQAAEAAGFRPCLRCRPQAVANPEADPVARACRLIEAAAGSGDAPPDLDRLAAAAGLSRFHFHRLFKTRTGVTPAAYARARRAEAVRKGLAGARSVTQAVYEAGFGSGSRFYERSSAMLGMTPTQFRRGGQGARIRFALGQCSLGAILVAATDQGICAISLGDDPDALLRELQDRFPHAELVGADAAFEQWVARVVGAVEAPALGLDLPLDVRGTAFQLRVWEALRALPAGSTISYAELAERIGAPGSARAVARACASNSVAVAIPCHRVVRGDGGVAGYRWGVERKRALLEREAGGSAGDAGGTS